MGIADRDYYRDDGRWHNPFARSQVSVFLAVAYLFVFVAQLSTLPMRGEIGGANPRGFTAVLELNADQVFLGEFWRVMSYAAVHQPENVLHVLFTCCFLLWIGRQIEDLYGNKEFLAYYLATTLLGGLSFVVIGAISRQAVGNLIGPSAAVTAIFVLFALHYPGRTINLFYFIPVPIWAVVILYAAYDIAAVSAYPGSGAVVAVHLAGASFAFIYHRYSLRVLNIIPSGARGAARFNRPKTKLRIFQDQPEKVPEPATAGALRSSVSQPAVLTAGLDEHFEAKLDEVLEKVNKSGKASLTPAEQEVLLRASAIFKKRRRSN